jgi:hypothetical protein
MNKRQGQPITAEEKQTMYAMYPTLAHLPSERQKYRAIGRRIGCSFTTVQRHVKAWQREVAA